MLAGTGSRLNHARGQAEYGSRPGHATAFSVYSRASNCAAFSATLIMTKLTFSAYAIGPKNMHRTIWQYWETRGEKPAFVGGLHELARRNSGCEVVLVTPQNLGEYLPVIPKDFFRIEPVAHKADMIRAMLLARYGGMWLDSDAIVLQDLSHLFGLLEDYDFVAFNNQGLLENNRPWVRVNCLISRPQGRIAQEWVRQQHAKFPKVAYNWEEIGTELLHPICLKNRSRVKILPFEKICPIPFNKVEDFVSGSDERILADDCYMVMLSNAVLRERIPALQRLSCQDIAEGNYPLSTIMRASIRGAPVDSRTENFIAQVKAAEVKHGISRKLAGRFMRLLSNRS